jgi:tetratricopeptide (TPR) repeat protein
MPSTTYMVVDPRRDHGFRVPRPDLSVALGVPDPCTACHTDRPAAWAAGHVQAWYGRPARGSQRYAEAFAAAATGAPGAAEKLIAVTRDGEQPAIARASALERLGRFPGPATTEVVRAALGDPDSLVRRAAVEALGGADPALRVARVAPRLDDPVRAVRLAAARALADVPRERLTETQRVAYDRALAEYVAAEQFNADRPESHLNLGLLYAARGRLTEAESALEAALALDPRFTPAAVNLADLHRAAGRDAEGERVLRRALEHDPRSAAAHHALGLLLVRQRRPGDALAALAEAARLDPDRARYGYVYAVALHEAGQPERARASLGRVLARHPHDREALAAAVAYAQEQGDRRQALVLARRLAEVDPSNAEVRRLVERLEVEGRK